MSGISVEYLKEATKYNYKYFMKEADDDLASLTKRVNSLNDEANRIFNDNSYTVIEKVSRIQNEIKAFNFNLPDCHRTQQFQQISSFKRMLDKVEM